MTSFADGETTSPCGNCLPGFFLTVASSLCADMGPDEAQTHADALRTLAGLLPDTGKSSRRSGKRSEPQTASPTDGDQASGPMPGEQPLIDECSGCGNLVNVAADGTVSCEACGTVSTPVTNPA